MRIAFLHYGQHPKYADVMLASVRANMPNVDLLHLTDADTDRLSGTITVRRAMSGDNPMIFKMEHLAELDGDVLVLDTDVVVQSDLRAVFNFDFDMALTWRDGPILDPTGVDIAKLMPINCGVMFQRNNEFWKDCLDWCRGKNVGWYADQMAVSSVCRTGKYRILRLHCDNFNYTPLSADDDVSRRYAVHYKGTKRKFMDARFGL